MFLDAYAGRDPANVAVYTEMAGNTGTWPMHVNWNEIFDIIQRELDMMLQGFVDAQTAVDSIEMQVTHLLQ